MPTASQLFVVCVVASVCAVVVVLVFHAIGLGEHAVIAAAVSAASSAAVASSGMRKGDDADGAGAKADSGTR